MNMVSLFAGVGGFDLAAEAAGMTVVGQVEWDRHAQQVLAHHWPDVPRWADINDVKWSDLEQPDVDVLAGGFPCQDYSVAGQRAGLAGDRGAEWWQFHRLIDEGRPTWVAGENVPGFLSSNGGRDFETIIASLVELGYGVVWRILDAQYFGVAQRRRRVFIVGHSGGQPRPEVLAFAQGVSGDTPPRREPGQNPAATLAARSRGGGYPGTDEYLNVNLVAATLETRPTDQRGKVEPNYLLAFNWQTSTDQLSARTEYIDALCTGQTPAVYQTHGTSVGPLGKLRADQSGVPFTIEPTVRRLTPMECERLQGFPDNWTANVSDTQRYRQMGNAVAVPVATWVMRQIATHS